MNLSFLAAAAAPPPNGGILRAVWTYRLDDRFIPRLIGIRPAIARTPSLPSLEGKRWTKIGAAFPHKEGIGFSIELKSFPICSCIVRPENSRRAGDFTMKLSDDSLGGRNRDVAPARLESKKR